jgi:uncharacterized protein YbaP (TraB family)
MRWLAGLWLLLAAALPALPARAAPGLWTLQMGKAEVTLYGTIHALPPDTPALSKRGRAQLARARVLVLEVVMPPAGAFAPLVAQLGMLPAPRLLAGRVPAAMAPRLERMAGASGLPLPVLERMADWYLAITLAQQSFAAAGVDPANGVESQLTALAKARGLRILGLETPTAQLRLLARLAPADQAALLADVVREADDVAQVQGLIAAWAAGDINRIARDFAEEGDASPAVRQALLVNRNRAWVRWLERQGRHRGRLFVAVGAAHLGGNQGLLALLRAKGIRARRLE